MPAHDSTTTNMAPANDHDLSNKGCDASRDIFTSTTAQAYRAYSTVRQEVNTWMAFLGYDNAVISNRQKDGAALERQA
jgi:hypothetical protein